MALPIDTLLLFSLPASGKSEVRRYMGQLTPQQCQGDFNMGSTLQLDDYPYVHLMHRIDDLLLQHGWKNVYYRGPSRPFLDEWTWAALIELLNEDYQHLLDSTQVKVSSAAQHLFDRLDRAHQKSGVRPALAEVPWGIRLKVGEALEAECRKELDTLNAQNALEKKGKTIVIECARGGPNGMDFPLTPPFGYDTAFARLSPVILERASVLYIWVEPPESRRKNIERGRPDGSGSILHHSVPAEVMLGQYAKDDMAYLLEQSDRAGTIRVDRVLERAGKYVPRSYYLPVGRFDNRTDRTSFVREAKEKWPKPDVERLHGGLKVAFEQIAAASKEPLRG